MAAPSNGSRLKGGEWLRSTLDAQRAAFAAQPMPGASMRREQLKRLKAALLTHKDALAAAESRDFGGHSLDEVMISEILPLIAEIDHAIRRVESWMRPSRRRVGIAFLPSSASVVHQPLGVVGVIAPWNYPVLLSIGPLVNLVAAGNRAMIRMSECTPATAHAVRAMLADVFAVDEVAVVSDDAGELAEAFGGLRFDHLVFTGSGTVGRAVMRAAADQLVPVTLELGGKSPVIIGEDAAIPAAAERICWGKSLKSGQSCTAPDYVLCPRARLDEFAAAYRVCYQRMFPTLKGNPDNTSIINERHYRRLLNLLEDAKSQGARLVQINPGPENLAATRQLPLVLVLDATERMKIMQQEIFGPILPILPYDRVEEAIDYVNGRPRPLALYVFSDDADFKRRVLLNTHSGAICFNDTMTQAGVSDLPFGGVGESGMGRYHGYPGFLTFSNARAVFTKGRFNSGRLMYAPYGRLLQRLALKFFLR